MKVWMSRGLYERAAACAHEIGIPAAAWIRRALARHDAARADLAAAPTGRIARQQRAYLDRLADAANRECARREGTCATVPGLTGRDAVEIRAAILLCVDVCERRRRSPGPAVAREEALQRRRRKALAVRVAGAEAYLAEEEQE